MTLHFTDKEEQTVSLRGISRRLVEDTPEEIVINMATAVAAEPQDPDCFAKHPLTEAVRQELQRYLGMSDADIAWVVEATVWHLMRLTRKEGAVDLDYLGEIHTAGESSFVWLRPHPRDAMARVLAGTSGEPA